MVFDQIMRFFEDYLVKAPAEEPEEVVEEEEEIIAMQTNPSL